MNTIGVALLVAATATTGIGKPHAGGLGLLRPHAVQSGPAPPGGPMNAAAMGVGGQDGAGFGAGRRFPNTRSQVFFVDPAGMNITWQTGGPGGERVYLPSQLVVPARYNFNQGYIYRLKVSAIPGYNGLTLYPTIEVAPSTPATDAYLTHNPIPCQFTPEDFDQVKAGNFVTKVIYLPDPKYQELAIAGVETLVSTRLEPGVDPILEADRRGTILMIVRLGAIDLEMPVGGSPMIAPGGMPMAAPGVIAPGNFVAPPGAPYAPSVAPPVAPAPSPLTPVDVAPVSPAPESDAVSPSPAPTTPPVPAPGIAPAPAPGVEPPAPAPGLAPPPAPGIDPPAPAPGIEPAPAAPPPAEPEVKPASATGDIPPLDLSPPAAK